VFKFCRLINNYSAGWLIKKKWKLFLNFYYVWLAVPGAPTILQRESRAEKNTVTVVWQPHSGSSGGAGGAANAGVNNGGCVDGYVLELDDGNGGDFRVKH